MRLIKWLSLEMASLLEGIWLENAHKNKKVEWLLLDIQALGRQKDKGHWWVFTKYKVSQEN